MSNLLAVAQKIFETSEIEQYDTDAVFYFGEDYTLKLAGNISIENIEVGFEEFEQVIDSVSITSAILIDDEGRETKIELPYRIEDLNDMVAEDLDAPSRKAWEEDKEDLHATWSAHLRNGDGYGTIY